MAAGGIAVVGITASLAQAYPEFKGWSERLFGQWWPEMTTTWFLILVVLAILSYIAALVWTGSDKRTKSVDSTDDSKSPLVIIFDPKNKLDRFWSLEAIYREVDGEKIYQGHNWEYRVLVKNVSLKTVKNVDVFTETLGADPQRPQQTHFDGSKEKSTTLHPNQEKFVMLLRWSNPPILAGMMAGDAYGPIKITVTGDDVLATSKTFRFNPENIPMISEL